MRAADVQSTLNPPAQLTPMQRIDWAPLTARGITFSIKREDLANPYWGGNKAYKLGGFLQQYFTEHYDVPLASFGGAWSNHLYALAAACQQLQLKSIGVIRGERPPKLSATLEDLQAMGMRLHFIPRQVYRRRGEKELIQTLEASLGRCYWIPEGGAGLTGAQGCQAIVNGILAAANQPVNVICHAVGTGTSLAGLASAVPTDVAVLGVSVIKGPSTLRQSIDELIATLGGCAGNWQLTEAFHCGGFAKAPGYLIEFMEKFENATGILLDPVYTAKLMWAITCLAQSNFWPSGHHIVAVHSGGLQGRRGYQLTPELTNCQPIASPVSCSA